MPGIGGIEVCQMLNNDPLGITIPIIVISALDKNVDKIKAYKLGVVDYLTKPFEANALLYAVEKAVKFRQPKWENKALLIVVASFFNQGINIADYLFAVV